MEMKSATANERGIKELKALQAISKVKHHTVNGCDNQFDDIEYHIVKYYGTFPCPYTSNMCLVFEYMAGGSLLNMLEAKHVFTEREIQVIAYSVLTAMKRITELNYIHRDIKVRNHILTIIIIIRYVFISIFLYVCMYV